MVIRAVVPRAAAHAKRAQRLYRIVIQISAHPAKARTSGRLAWDPIPACAGMGGGVEKRL